MEISFRIRHIVTIDPEIPILDISVQFSLVAQSCPTLCDPMKCSTPGLPVHHQLPEFTRTHVRVRDAILPSHPLSSPSPPAPNPSQHPGLFQWVNSSHEVAKVLELQPQHQSFQWTPRTGLDNVKFGEIEAWVILFSSSLGLSLVWGRDEPQHSFSLVPTFENPQVKLKKQDFPGNH